MTNRFEELLAQRPWLLSDGAMGTNLFEVGLRAGDAPELWNVDRPGEILTLQKSFVEAGSDVILTNSFGGTANRLRLHKAEDCVYEINKAAAELSRRVADGRHGRTIAVGGSMGPTGDILAPLGPLSPADCVAAFRAQAEALKAGGVDVFWIETMYHADEVRCAVEAVKDLGLPFVVSMTFDSNGRTMTGVTPQQLLQSSRSCSSRPRGYGFNCGVGPAETMAAVLNAGLSTGENDLIIVKSNCGIPEYKDGGIVYSGTPELMAEYARMAIDAGARVVGGCCGTSVGHLKAMREALDSHSKREKPSLADVVSRLGEISNGAREINLDPSSERPESSAGAGRRRRRGSRKPSST